MKPDGKSSIEFPDLTKTFPRSPRVKMAGLAHVARMTDKARALKMGTQGEYKYPCPLDEIVLEFIGVESGKFMEQATTLDDPKVSDWVESLCHERNPEAKETFNANFLKQAPDSEKAQDTFSKIRDKIDSSRTDVETWVDLIDLEEGRL